MIIIGMFILLTLSLAFFFKSYDVWKHQKKYYDFEDMGEKDVEIMKSRIISRLLLSVFSSILMFVLTIKIT